VVFGVESFIGDKPMPLTWERVTNITEARDALGY